MNRVTGHTTNRKPTATRRAPPRIGCGPIPTPLDQVTSAAHEAAFVFAARMLDMDLDDGGNPIIPDGQHEVFVPLAIRVRNAIYEAWEEHRAAAEAAGGVQ